MIAVRGLISSRINFDGVKESAKFDMATTNSFGELGLSIVGVGSHYPPYSLKPNEVQTLAEKYYPESEA